MSGISEISAQLLHDLKQLTEESRTVYETVVKPAWDTGAHHYSATLYGYVMLAFSQIDVCSRLHDGDITKQQTGRMVNFLQNYLRRDVLADEIAVQLWRHTLMHTRRPRRLKHRRTGETFYYLLHWGADHLPRDQHYVITGDLGERKLNLALDHLLQDLAHVLDAYVSDLESSPSLQTKALAVWPSIEVQEFQ